MLDFNGFDIGFHMLRALKAQRIGSLTMPRMSLKSDDGGAGSTLSRQWSKSISDKPERAHAGFG
jgi:hypothetical protein